MVSPRSWPSASRKLAQASSTSPAVGASIGDPRTPETGPLGSLRVSGHPSCASRSLRSVLPGLAPVAIVASSIWLAWALWARRGEHAVASGALLLALSVAHLSQVRRPPAQRAIFISHHICRSAVYMLTHRAGGERVRARRSRRRRVDRGALPAAAHPSQAPPDTGREASQRRRPRVPDADRYRPGPPFSCTMVMATGKLPTPSVVAQMSRCTCRLSSAGRPSCIRCLGRCAPAGMR